MIHPSPVDPSRRLHPEWPFAFVRTSGIYEQMNAPGRTALARAKPWLDYRLPHPDCADRLGWVAISVHMPVSARTHMIHSRYGQEAR